MRCFVPRLGTPSADLRKVETPETFGGLPTGLPQTLWPRCSVCGRPLSFVGQFADAPGRLDIGGRGAKLYVFQCEADPGMCYPSEIDTDACIIAAPTSSDATEPPAPTPPPLPRIPILDWHESDDGLDPRHASRWYDQAYFDTLEPSRVLAPAKIGGLPHWVQGPGASVPSSEPAHAPWRFLLQIPSELGFRGAPPDLTRLGYDTMRQTPKGPQMIRPGHDARISIAYRCVELKEDGYRVDLACFGENGTGYVFLQPETGRAALVHQSG